MSDIVLETDNLTKYYGSKPAVDHLTVQIPKGSVCGFIGRNGAGKTTAIRMMIGQLVPTLGSARLLGCESAALTDEIRRRTGYVTEGHRLFRWMTIAALEKFQRAFFPDQWDNRFFADMIEYFELSPGRKIKHLSNGQRAQVSLALALAPNPELLIMDDPTLGLDAAIRRQFLEGIIELIMQQGRTVLFSSHILADVERVADRIIVIDKGTLRANCTLEQFQKSIKKVRMSFAQTPPTEPDIPGLLHCKYIKNNMEMILVNCEQTQINAWADSAGACECEIVGMTLEDQFIEFTSPTHRKRFFQQERS